MILAFLIPLLIANVRGKASRQLVHGWMGNTFLEGITHSKYPRANICTADFDFKDKCISCVRGAMLATPLGFKAVHEKIYW